jgi:hypothetical protein
MRHREICKYVVYERVNWILEHVNSKQYLQKLGTNARKQGRFKCPKK